MMNFQSLNLTVLLLYVLFPFFLYSQDAITADISHPTFNNDCQGGAIDLHINDGFAPYNVTWYGTINLPSGDFTWIIQENFGVQADDPAIDLDNVYSDIVYTVDVTDALCGTAIQTFEVECVCSDDCQLVGQVTHASCGTAGEILAEIQCEEEGHAPFTYYWTNIPPSVPNGSPNLTAKPGTYCLRVTDGDGCEYENCWTIQSLGQYGELSIEPISQENISYCTNSNDECTGSISINVSPPDASIQWTGIPNLDELHSDVVTDLCPGTYTVEVSVGSCSLSESFTIECCTSFDPISPGFEETVPPLLRHR